MLETLSRARLLKMGTATIVALVVAPGKAAAAMRGTGAALGVSARNVGRRYAGDRPLFATVSPGIDGRDAAAIRFRLPHPASIRLEAVQTALRTSRVVWETSDRLGRGEHVVSWAPEAGTPVGSYVMRLTVTERSAPGTTRLAVAMVRLQPPAIAPLSGALSSTT